jgi:hypothetical protein
MRHLSIAVLLAVVVVSCTTDFEEINTNPNAPTIVTPNLLLPNIIRAQSNMYLDYGWSYGNIVIQHTSKRQFVNEDRYLWGDISAPWDVSYSTLRDVKNMINSSKAAGLKNYEGVALIMRCLIIQGVTDLYGECPNTEATSAVDGIVQPKYDKQEEIYNAVLADLKTANSLVGSGTEAVEGDILYSGNLTKWKKLANSLRIRMLMRISNKRSVNADLAEIIGDPGTYPIFTAVSDEAALTYLNAFPNQFPLHITRVGSFKEFCLSKTLADTLLHLKDPRIKVFGRPTEDNDSVYAGLPNGLSDVDALNYGNSGRAISYVGTIWFEEAITPRGLKIAKGVFMSYAELQFLLAEAAQRGLIGGSANTYYEDGIKAAFAHFDTPIPADYLTKADVILSGGDPLVRIGTQKWISLFYHGMEAWADWRRTGFPVLLPGPSNLNGNRIPSRFAYPLSEQALNAAKRSEAVSRQGADDINTKLWWDVQ